MPERSAVASTLMRYLPHRPRSRGQGVLIGVGCAAIGYLLRELLDPLILGVPFVTFFPLLVVATIWGGAWAGTTTLLLGGLIGAYFWVPPRGSLDLGLRAAVSVVAFLIGGGSVVVSVNIVNEVIAALRRSEARSAMFAREMQHRVKNVLALVQAISRMTARSGGTAEEHQARLSERIQALSAAGDARREAPHLPVDLEDLLRRVLDPFGMARFAFVGTPSVVSDEISSTLGLTLYELATNAAKYGALSTQNGRVTVRWKAVGSLIDLEWKETGGPQVTTPTRQGFGSTLLRTAFSPNGATELSYEADGHYFPVVG
ncbi:HWE histidine kinase domain-containing protein [Mesorhizobium sp. VK22B]|uniref:histidine kinase n=1 Tax=Mesorhizobium captivum TaxID=3072319 RepID=A0ABU4Z2B0_9HYPH|nr:MULTISPECIES: HWE histidine kinase domain-containing protein [unclassified Mesorhizobium]MDX8492485.1 HWE histidine kinase domain-containing protein [Mesorhizobium sp. VK22B]MDX8505574.1 HWE histidine kinase domain-containing protein [Mesorhizobium sp. VK22E]